MVSTVKGGRSSEKAGKRAGETVREHRIKGTQQRGEQSPGCCVSMQNIITHFLAVPLHSAPALYREAVGRAEEVVGHWPKSIHCFSVV